MRVFVYFHKPAEPATRGPKSDHSGQNSVNAANAKGKLEKKSECGD